MQARLTIDELYQLKWLIGCILSLLALWALSGLDLFGIGLNSMIMAIVVMAFLKPGWVHRIPEAYWSRFFSPLILVLVLIDFGLGFTSLIAPLMRMVVLLLLYRTLAPRNRGEDLQMLLLTLLSIVVSGAITVSLLFAVQILLFAPVAMTFLLIVCILNRGAEAENYHLSWEQFSLKRLIKRVRHTVEIRAFALGGLLFAFVVAISTAFFIFIPRFDIGKTIPFLQLDTKPRSGFSDVVSLNSVSEIIEDQSIALRLDVPDRAAISSLPYWRILVLDQYQKGEFSLSDSASKSRKYLKRRELSKWARRRVPLELRQAEQCTFYFEGGVSQYLPLPTMFRAIRFTKEQALELLPDIHIIGLNAVQKSTFSYQIDDLNWAARAPASNLENKAFEQYFNDKKTGNEGQSDYPLTTLALSLSDSDKALLSNLNDQLTGNSGNLPIVAEYSERVTSYLRENFRYSLKPEGTQGLGDPIVNWIRNGSTGHCELYAGAFVLLAREAGYPARMVVGFVGGSWNAVEDFFVVRNSDAHAWVEIYDSENKQWLRVDPTPGASSADPEAAVPVSFKIETGMRAWIDSLRMQWYRRVISFDQNDQVEMATSLAELGNAILKRLSEQFREWIVWIKGWFSRSFTLSTLFLLGLILVAVCVVYYLRITFFSWSDLLLRLFGKSEPLSPIRKQASRYMSQLRQKMILLDVGKDHIATLQQLYSQLEALRFGPDTSPQAASLVFKKTRKVLRKRKIFRF